MSVLYKALQKAEKENEQRQTPVSGQGFDPGRLAGSGAIKLAGGRNVNWRIAAFAGVGVVAVAIGGALLLMPQQPAQRPQVATLTPPVAAHQPALPAAVPPAPAMAQAGAEAPAAPASPPVDAPPAGAPQVASAEPPASAVAAPAPATTAPKEAAAPQAPAPQPAVPVVVAAAQPQASVSQPATTPVAVASATPAPAAPAAAMSAPSASTPTQPSPVKVALPPSAPAKLPPIPADSPAQALSPPIAISRADFALSGVGNAVQVRQVSKDAQDNVGAGYTALLRGEYDTALGFYDRALTKEPSSVLALLGRGASLQKLHRLDEAQVAYTGALKIDPQNREALTNVTAIIGERLPAEALNRLLELEKEYPGFSPIKAQIGLIYAKQGSMETALDYLRRAVALAPESTMYQYNLALVLDHMGLHEQAVQAYENVLGALAGGNGPPELSSTDIERRVRYLRVK